MRTTFLWLQPEYSVLFSGRKNTEAKLSSEQFPENTGTDSELRVGDEIFQSTKLGVLQEKRFRQEKLQQTRPHISSALDFNRVYLARRLWHRIRLESEAHEDIAISPAHHQAPGKQSKPSHRKIKQFERHWLRLHFPWQPSLPPFLENTLGIPHCNGAKEKSGSWTSLSWPWLWGHGAARL